MSPQRRPRRTAAPAVFLLFAAALVFGLALGATGAEASLPRATDLAAPNAAPLELAAPDAVLRDATPGIPLANAPDLAPRLGFAEDVCLLDADHARAGMTLFARETCRCERTYARNNPLKYVDRDGRENELAIDAMQRDQIRELYGEAAVSRMDAQRAVIGTSVLALLGGGAAVAEWGPAIMAFGRELMNRFGDRIEQVSATTRGTTSSLLRFDPGTVLNDANKVSHMFQEGHQLEKLGTKTEALGKIVEAVQRAYSSGTLALDKTGVFNQVLKIDGKDVKVQGKVIDDLLKIGDAWIPR